jgi:predicted dehydrogenase
MVNVAISGLGEISFSHYHGILGTQHGTLAGVYSHSKARTDEIAKLWHTKPYSSFEQIIDDPSVDAVVVCTSDAHHHDEAVAAMRAEKNVLVEKPLALSLRDVVDMARVSKEEAVVLFPVHNYLFRPKVRRAKELISTRAIGDPSYALFVVTQKMAEGVAKRYHGALYTQAYHSIYVSNYLLGIPVMLQAAQSTLTFRTLKNDDLFVATFKYEGGAIGNIVANWCADDISRTSWTWLDKVVGTGGVITISSFDDIAYTGKGSFMMSQAIDYQRSFDSLMKHFIDEVLYGGEKPIQTPYDAVVVEDMMSKLKESAVNGETISYVKPSLGNLIEKL